jgi:ATP-binding cassette, subfamily B, bacterial
MGQRQLVALARVVLKDPAIFILDEATASVDPFTEAQIQEGLETIMRDRTAIVIAHRLFTVKHADRIIVMRDGRIIEEGSHEAAGRGRPLRRAVQHLLPAPVAGVPVLSPVAR